MARYPSSRNYASSRYSNELDLKKEVKADDKQAIRTFFDNLNIESSQDLEKMLETSSYELKGEIRVLHGYARHFHRDTVNGNTTRVQFTGALEYGENSMPINETYEVLATRAFHPTEPDNSDPVDFNDNLDNTEQEVVSD